jgi:lysophospholipase L1-like esterase
MGLTARPAASVLILGDSIAAGTGDLIDTDGRMGFIQRSLTNAVPWVSLARGSTSAAQLAANPRGAYRLSIETGVTDVILEYCRNDLASGGSNAAQLVALLQSIAAPYLATGKRVWICTSLPTTSSTDGWTSDSGQTVVYSSQETQRLAYNANVRANVLALGFSGLIDIANVVESATAAGKWRSDGGAWTTDGIHPNSTLGHPGIVSAGVMPLSSFVL